jgi:hypothetical protein
LGGNRFTNSILLANLGTSAANTLTGTAGAEILNGADGDDTLVGSGVTLHLTTIPDNRILGIETIDITGSGNNTLTLNHREVLNISDESNTLIVRRNAADVVNIGAGWTQILNQTIGLDMFNVYSHGAARLLVQTTATDTSPPTVTSIIAAGSAWSPAFIDSVDGGGTGAGNGLGYELTSNLTLPNAGIDRLYVQFSEPVVGFNASRLQLLGVNVADYSTTPGFLTVSYDATNLRGVMQFASSITKDKLRIGVSDAIDDVASNALDGDANAAAGGILNFRFNILVGDANNDGSVNGGELPLFSANFNQSLPGAEQGELTFPMPLLPLIDSFDEEELYAPLIDDYFSQFDEEDELLPFEA